MAPSAFHPAQGLAHRLPTRRMRAQKAVDYLSDQQFPVQQVTIVGVDLMQVERVTSRLTWPKVLGGGI